MVVSKCANLRAAHEEFSEHRKRKKSSEGERKRLGNEGHQATKFALLIVLVLSLELAFQLQFIFACVCVLSFRSRGGSIGFQEGPRAGRLIHEQEKKK